MQQANSLLHTVEEVAISLRVHCPVLLERELKYQYQPAAVAEALNDYSYISDMNECSLEDN